MQSNTNKKFLSPQVVLFQAGLKAGQVVADLGVGSGFYAIASAGIVGPHGQVHAVDVKESALDHTVAQAQVNSFRTITTYLCDLEHDKTCHNLPAGTCDMVVISNILHEIKDNKNILKHAYSLLKTGGKLLVVDWNDEPSPFGPPAEKRVNQPLVKKQIEDSHMKFVKELDTDQYHFGMVFEK